MSEAKAINKTSEKAGGGFNGLLMLLIGVILVLGGGGRESVVRLSPRLTVNDIEAQLLAARGGRGIARLLSYQVADDLAAGALIRIMRDWESPPVPVQLVASGGRHMAPKVRAFLDHAAEALLALPVIHQ